MQSFIYIYALYPNKMFHAYVPKLKISAISSFIVLSKSIYDNINININISEGINQLFIFDKVALLISIVI